MTLDFVRNVRKFEQCSRERIQIRRYAKFLRLFLPSVALEEVVINLLDPLRKYSRGHANLLLITDHFERFNKTVSMFYKQLKA